MDRSAEGNNGILATYCAAMTGWFKGDEITYQVSDCLLGKVLVAQTATGVCAVLLGDSEQELVEELRTRFSGAAFQPVPAGWAQAQQLQPLWWR